MGYQKEGNREVNSNCIYYIHYLIFFFRVIIYARGRLLSGKFHFAHRIDLLDIVSENVNFWILNIKQFISPLSICNS